MIKKGGREKIILKSFSTDKMIIPRQDKNRFGIHICSQN